MLLDICIHSGLEVALGTPFPGLCNVIMLGQQVPMGLVKVVWNELFLGERHSLIWVVLSPNLFSDQAILKEAVLSCSFDTVTEAGSSGSSWLNKILLT